MPQNVDGRDRSTGARPVGPPARRPLAAWLVPLLILLVVLVVLGLLLNRCGSGSSGSGGKTAASPSAITAPTTALATTPAAASTPTSGAGPAGGTGGPGTITAQGATVLPLPGSSMASLAEYSEGKAQLDAQGYHFDANKSSLKLAP